MAQLAENARSYAYEFTQEMAPGSSQHFSSPLRQVGARIAKAQPATAKRTGRRGTPDDYYLPYAQMYHQVKSQGSGKPVADVHLLLRKAEREHKLPSGLYAPTGRGVVRDLIHQCRVRGLLSTDGRLTAKALELAQSKGRGGKQ